MQKLLVDYVSRGLLCHCFVERGCLEAMALMLSQAVRLDVVQRAFYLFHLRLDGFSLTDFIDLTSLLLLSCEEGPVKELHGHLNVVLELPLCELIPGDGPNIENVFIPARTEHLDHFLPFLHPHDRPVVEMHLDCVVRIRRESSKSIDFHFANNLGRAAHVLDEELCLLHGLLDSASGVTALTTATVDTLLLKEDKVAH